MKSGHKEKPTKTDAIRDYLAKHPHASNEEVATALKRQGMEINKKSVSAIKSQLGLGKSKPQGEGRSLLRPPNALKPLILIGIEQRGGRVEIGTRRKPGKDRNLYVEVAEALCVNGADRKKTIGEINPDIYKSKRKDIEKDAKRNAWDYNMLVAVQQLKDPRFGEPFIISPNKNGVWELIPSGADEAQRLIREQK